MNIGLALSGGGLRATVYHLGILARLADEALLDDVVAVSTVSGGSLCIGLVFAANDYQWPTTEQYRDSVVPRIRALLTTQNLQRSYFRRILSNPASILRERAGDLSALMQSLWGIHAKVTDLPQKPYWFINATCYETGVNWRFTRERMGDYIFGYTTPDVLLTDALAASAAVPGLIGPLVLDTSQFTWKPYQSDVPIQPLYKRVSLWDGGVYENLGVEPLFKPGKGYRHDVEFLLTSDAGAKPGGADYSFFGAAYRLIGLATNQVRSLRARSVVAHLQDGNPGSYMQIDNSAAYLLGRAHLDDEIAEIASRYLPDDEVHKAAAMESTIRQLTLAEFQRLFRQGFEVADITMYAFKSGGHRPLRGYDSTAWW